MKLHPCPNRLLCLLFTALASLLPCLSPASAQPAGSKPNILLIVADDLGFSDLGCYGGEIATPNLDQLAKDGVRFTQFYNAGRCWPTRAAIVTGYYPRQTNNDPVSKARTSPAWATGLPNYLKKAGYRSYHSGKWHFNSLSPQTAGFDEDSTAGSWDDHFMGGKHSSVKIVDEMVKFLQQHQTQNAGTPFYAQLDFLAPHFPLHASEEDINLYRDRYLDGWDKLREERYERIKSLGIFTHPLPPLELGLKPGYTGGKPAEVFGELEPLETVAWDSLSEAAKRFQATKMAIHAAMVHQLDRETGRLIEHLKQTGQFENTVILFISDNGADSSLVLRGKGQSADAVPGSSESYLCLGPGWASASNTPFKRHKIFQHEGGIATPLIVHWPSGNLPKGELRHTMGHVIDFLPTFLDLAGISGDPLGPFEGKPPFPGKSLVPAFAKEGAVEREFLYFDHSGEKALRMGDWKLVSPTEARTTWRLYNLATDRGEINDLAAAEPERVKTMRAFWQEKQKEYDATK